jgi:hypothetical protein
MNEVQKRLSGLVISVAEQEDGKFAVFTTAEPLFCFVRDTETAALAAVEDTLKSYIKHFHNADATITLEVTPVSPVRQIRLEPRRRVLPRFSSVINGDDRIYA